MLYQMSGPAFGVSGEMAPSAKGRDGFPGLKKLTMPEPVSLATLEPLNFGSSEKQR
jgi:hypothetical protein